VRPAGTPKRGGPYPYGKETAMAPIIRVKLNWSGFIGAPGYTNLFFETTAADPWDQTYVDDAVAKVDAFLGAFPTYLPQGLAVAIDSTVAQLDEVTGTMTAAWTVVPPTARSGTSATAYAAGAGLCITWITGEVQNGRIVRGRTFIVPLAGAGYDNDGSIYGTLLTAARAAATDLTSDSGGSRLVVWKRPNPIIPIDGGAYNVIGSTINDKAAQLRSRRD
jgi:hypothetical protein